MPRRGPEADLIRKDNFPGSGVTQSNAGLPS
jgi:hypothetical protein